MAIKTFTTGEVLTASDTNTYLANAGLVFIKQQTIGSTVSSVTITDAFNSSFTNYRVTVDGSDGAAADTNVHVKFETVLSTYNWAQRFTSYGGTAGDAVAASTNAGILVGLTSTDNDTSFSFDVFQPNEAKFTHVTFISAATNYWNTGGGVMKTATAYTTLILNMPSTTLTGGTIRIYGYRNG